MNIGQFAVANLSEGYFKIRRHSNGAEGLGESGIRKGRVHGHGGTLYGDLRGERIPLKSHSRFQRGGGGGAIFNFGSIPEILIIRRYNLLSVLYFTANLYCI